MFDKSIASVVFLTSVFLIATSTLTACGEGTTGPGNGPSKTAGILSNLPTHVCDITNPGFVLTSENLKGGASIGPGCYSVSENVTIKNAQLTILPGTKIQFSPDTSLKVENGSLIAEGTLSQPILFTAEYPPIDNTSWTGNSAWTGIVIKGNNGIASRIQYAVIEYAGGPVVPEDARASISFLTASLSDYENNIVVPRSVFSNNVIRNGAGKYGLVSGTYAYMGQIENNVFYNNLGYPAIIDINESFKISKSNAFSLNGIGNKNNMLVVRGNELNMLKFKASQPEFQDPNALPLRDAFWANLSIPYLFQSNVKVMSTTVTIEAGTRLLFEESAGLTIDGAASSLVSKGAPNQEIIMESTKDTLGNDLGWQGLSFARSNGNPSSIEYTQILGAGNSSINPQDASVHISENSSVVIQHSQLSNSFGYGLFLDRTSSLPNFFNNHLLNNALGVAYIAPNNMKFLVAGNTYGNASINSIENSISIGKSTPASDSNYVFRNFNVPYLLRFTLEVQNDLSLEPGTTFLFGENVGIRVTNNAIFNAIGTANAPITFSDLTQIEDPTGFIRYWKGIEFSQGESINQSQSHFSYVYIDHAGRSQSSLSLTNFSFLNIDNSSISEQDPSSFLQNTNVDFSSNLVGINDPSNNLF